MGKQPLVVLTGPTAVGKTKASIGLAHAIGGEIISADSMQVYRHMDIGSAKIKKEEMDGVRHHLIDVLDPEEEFHVVRFQQMAKEAMKEIYAAGHIPIIAGGTGFYIQALLYDINFEESEQDDALREELEQYAQEHGAEALHDRLALVDPKSAEEITGRHLYPSRHPTEKTRQATGQRVRQSQVMRKEIRHKPPLSPFSFHQATTNGRFFST